jgi:magnesium chelatase accessory protein
MNQSTFSSTNAWHPSAAIASDDVAQDMPSNWPNRDCSRIVRTDDAAWHIQCLGKGPVLLLLHGTGSSTHTWDKMLPMLAAQYSVLAVDLPGHGFSSPLRSRRMSLAAISAALHRLLRTLGVRPSIIVGHSAGAAIAIKLALRQDAMPQHIIGINAALRPFGGAFAGLFAPLAKSMAALPFLPAMMARRAANRDVVRNMLASTGSTLDDKAIDCYQRLLGSERHVAATLRMMADWNLRSLVDDMGAISARCHLIVGESDSAVPPSQAAAIRERYTDVSVTTLAGLGHLANEERPELLVSEIVKLSQSDDCREC